MWLYLCYYLSMILIEMIAIYLVISDGDYKELLNNEIAIPAWEEK